TGKRVSHALLKGRTNYACLYRARDGLGLDQESLLGGAELAEALSATATDPSSKVGAEVVALREWIEREADTRGGGDRDDAPTHTGPAWAQVSIPSRECLGAQRCPYGSQCFVERSRETARSAQLVVTNHAMLAIDAMNDGGALPEHDAVIIDEAHELVGRVTSAASHELSPQLIERVGRRCLPWLDDDLALEFLDTGEDFKTALDNAPVERVENPDGALADALRALRDVSRRVTSAMAKGDASDNDRVQAAAAVQELYEVTQQLAALSPFDVIWVSERERFGRQLNSAPLTVAGLMREGIFAKRPTVLTSATLTIGGSFDAVAGSVGLTKPYASDGDAEPELPRWRGLDVGSPFDYTRQGILYVARSLPPPGRDGIGPATLAEIAELVWAAGGRTLGLFASQRAAEAAAVYCRRELPDRQILCQGDAQLGELTRTFVADPETSLFGTLSLWQGVDVPGDTCELVIIDKIPFPRPDDPLLQARQRAVAEAGGNGFMAVAANHAALLLAQGSGRLIRRLTDRGVVAVLDPRLITARYGSYLRASMPDFWMTTDRETAIGALRRLQEARAQ
ncbi:MAG: ATP-dependent DNA helicase, partial [Micropruina sp.]|nr:ATP-dependent DNA helicase [Micropruina sp.]